MMNIWKTLATKTLIDTGPIVALIVRRDRYHHWSVSILDDISGILLTNPAVLTEAFHLLRKTDKGPSVLMQMIEERLSRLRIPIQHILGIFISNMKNTSILMLHLLI